MAVPVWLRPFSIRRSKKCISAFRIPFRCRSTEECPARSLNLENYSAGKDNSKMPYNEIPSPPGLPLIGTLLDVIKAGSILKIHEYCDRRHKQLGPIYKEKLGNVEAVFIADSGMIGQVYQMEGKYPTHQVPEPWVVYNEKFGCQRGLFFMDGPEWAEKRSILNKVLLNPNSMSSHADSFCIVVDDVIDRWRTIRQDGVLSDLEGELYKWSIESLGTMLFGRRFGCISYDKSIEVSEFVQSVQQIFRESAIMTMIPPRLAAALHLPVWRRFVKAVQRALEIANHYVENTVKVMQMENLEASEDNSIVFNLLRNQKIPQEELIRIVTDLFLAAADTTSHTTQWCLYLLAKYPEVQKKIYNEISSIVPPNKELNKTHMANLTYVKAVVKEALRLYPVAPFLTRYTQEDFVINGYRIPKGKLLLISLYTTGRDPKYFSDPEEFKPERWIRKPPKGEVTSGCPREVINTLAYLPFGIGPRSCIGRRVAEITMNMLLAKTVKNFHLSVENKNEVEMVMRMITVPSETIKLKLVEREG